MSRASAFSRGGPVRIADVITPGNCPLLRAASSRSDATRTSVLRQAKLPDARYIIVAPDRDDAAVLITLTARQLNAHATLAVAVRESENEPLLLQSGATAVITSSEAVGNSSLKSRSRLPVFIGGASERKEP